MIKCKYCDSKAEMKSYRERDGQTASEIVCAECNSLANHILNLRAYDDFEEGDYYWALERKGDGSARIDRSCWDDVSLELRQDNNFKTLDEACTFTRALGYKEVIVGDWSMDTYTIKLN